MTPDSFDIMRNAMVISQLRPNAVTDPRVIEAMASVPREDFVPAEQRATAYADFTIPTGDGRGMNPPTVTGRLLNEARIEARDHVLIVGAASGYVAAVVAKIANKVSSVDARAVSDGTLTGQYDVIFIDGAVEHVPDALVEQLAPGGRLVTGVVESGVTRLAVGRRGGAGFGLSAFADADVVVLPEFARPRAFVF